MRNNGPVTNKEIYLHDEDILVTRTDTGGRITFANNAFIAISGFTQEELLGSPHNILRHPDMPREAFADLWETIKSGRPWDGLVKNRTKNGDHYWVSANVTPEIKEGEIVGYISIRSKPGKEQIAEAEQIYKKFQNGQQHGLTIERGQVVSTTWLNRLFHRRASIVNRLHIVIGLLMLLMAGVSFLGWSGMSTLSRDLRYMYSENTVTLGRLANIVDLMRANLNLVSMMQMDIQSGADRNIIENRISLVEKNIDAISALWSEVTQADHSQEETDLIESFAEKRSAFVKQGLRASFDIARRGDSDALREHIQSVMQPMFEASHEKQQALVDYQITEARQSYTDADGRFKVNITLVIGVTAIAGIAGVVLGSWLLKAVRRPTLVMEKHFQEIANGNLKYQILPASVVEFSPMNAMLRTMKAKLAYGIIEQKQLQQENEEKRKYELEKMADALELKVGGVAQTLAAASNQLQGNAQSLSSIAQQTIEKSAAVSCVTGEVTGNVQAVSAASTELSASVTEISRQVSHAASIANDAVHQANEADATVRGLAESAKRIGEVVSLINDIASQTNLLALNATIEAARAGEAGKGFAVVANEVKHLSNQTAKATEEITSQISAIQSETESAVQAIQGIGKIIGTINELSSAIAAAVEEQGAATAEIARSAEQAANGTASAAESVAIVAHAAEETGSMAGLVLGAADALNDEARNLEQDVNGFVQFIRQA